MKKKQAANDDAGRQADKFTSAARQLACDESEEHFDAALKKVAAHKPASDPPETPPKSKNREK